MNKMNPATIPPELLAQINGNPMSINDFQKPSEHVGDEPRSKHMYIWLNELLNREIKRHLRDSGVQLQQYVGMDSTGSYQYKCMYDESPAKLQSDHDFIIKASYTGNKEKISKDLHDEQSTDQMMIDIILQREAGESVEDVCNRIEGITSSAASIQSNKTTIRTMAKQEDLDKIAGIDKVRTIEKVYVQELNINHARRVLGADVEAQPDEYVIATPPFSGQNEVITVADGGFDIGSASEYDTPEGFTNRVVRVVGMDTEQPDCEDTDGHGTHVCGCALGNGKCSEYAPNVFLKGTAPDAKLVMLSLNGKRYGENGEQKVSFFPEGSKITVANLLHCSYYEYNSRINSYSWGVPFITKREDQVDIMKQLPYNTMSEELDEFVLGHPDTVVCVAAGNSGDEPLGKFVGHIGEKAASKNCITVGSCGNSLQNQDIVSPFSSRGPTVEGRIKPDLVAPGEDIVSFGSRRVNEGKCQVMSGTSMATPLVAGCAAVIREALRGIAKVLKPSAALIKAILINGAVDLGLPRTKQGYGRVNLQNSLNIVASEKHSLWLESRLDDPDIGCDYEAAHFEMKMLLPVEASTGTLKVTMVYSDNPGGLLQNDLNFFVKAYRNGEPTRKWYGNAEREDVTVEDHANTVRQVVWRNLPRDTQIMLVVNVNGVMIADSQKYALVWTCSKD